MECGQALCKLNYEVCFTFACNMFRGMDLDRDDEATFDVSRSVTTHDIGHCHVT